MRSNKWLVLWLVLFCSPAFAQLSVTVKPAKSVVTAVTIESMQLQTADGQAIGSEVTRELPPVVRPGVPAAVVFVRHERPINELLIKIKCRTADATQIEPGVFVVSKPGRHELEINVIGQNPLTWDDETITVEVGGSPGPQPPGPTPTPDGTAPIDGPGFRVLFVFESSEALSPQLQQVFYGPEVRSFLTANAIKVDGTPDWRIVDKDVKFTDPNHRFARAMARPRSAIPWLMISNGVSGYEGPFPGGVAETLELLRSYVGTSPPAPTPTPIRSKATVTIYTTQTCLWCDKWKSMELDSLLAGSQVDYREIEDTAGTKSTHPTFVISKGSKNKTLIGYQSAAKLIEEASKL